MTDRTKVLYNANCPVCRFEIDHYAQYCAGKRLPIRFDDLNTEALADWNIDADTAARRLYVLHDGQLYSGIPAFIVLWKEMPRYRWVARLIGLPVIHRLACWSYDYALAPIIYRWHIWRLARA